MPVKHQERQFVADSILAEILKELPVRSITPQNVRGILTGIDSFLSLGEDSSKKKLPLVIPAQIVPSFDPVANQKKALIGRILGNRPQDVSLPFFMEMPLEDIEAWAQEYAPDAL